MRIADILWILDPTTRVKVVRYGKRKCGTQLHPIRKKHQIPAGWKMIMEFTAGTVSWSIAKEIERWPVDGVMVDDGKLIIGVPDMFYSADVEEEA